jgi:hypothetical protein
MDAKIDYLSFTVPSVLFGAGHGKDVWKITNDLLMEKAGAEFVDWLARADWAPSNGRGIYGASLYQPSTFTRIWFGGSANHILVEITGTGCSSLRDAHLLDLLIERVADRCTRLDVAVDMMDAGFPAEFVSAGYAKRFKSRSSWDTSEGFTEYVGSMKSELYARVYLYKPPHPRSGVMRVEMVTRAQRAKDAAAYHVQNGLTALALALGDTFQWQSPRWSRSQLEPSKLPTKREERHGGTTIQWLFRQVLPALLRLQNTGEFDVREWLENTVLPALEDGRTDIS